jgi:pilus assembly protein TadC
MNSQLGPFLFGAVSLCLLLRLRARSNKSRALIIRLANQPNRSSATDGRRRGVLERSIVVGIPVSMRRWTKVSAVDLKIWILLASGIILVLAPAFAPALLVLGIGIRKARMRRLRDQLRARRQAALPDLVDMIRLCVASGCTPYGALVVLGSLPVRVEDPLGGLIVDAADELERGAVVSEVLDRFQSVVGEAARPLCSALRSSADLGTPITETLDVLAREARRSRKAQADVAAKRLPVLLLFPLITCILPAFALLAIVPLLGGALSALRW